MSQQADARESLYARATRIGPTLPGALGRIASYFAQHPDRAAVSSALEVASATGTSDASVIRTARALGYAGMKEVRRAALELVGQRVNPGKVLEQRIERVRGGALSRVIDDTVEALRLTREAIDEDEWQEIVTTLATARRVFCYGLKPVGFVADYLAFMFNRAGVDARSATVTGVLLADFLIPIAADDVLVVFAPIRQFDEIVAGVRAAHERGATVLLVTEAIGMPIRQEVDFTIITSPTSMSAASDSSLPLSVAQALFLGVAALRPERATTAMDRLNDLRTTVSEQEATITPQALGLDVVAASDDDGRDTTATHEGDT